jgi:hypothetical protein
MVLLHRVILDHSPGAVLAGGVLNDVNGRGIADARLGSAGIVYRILADNLSLRRHKCKAAEKELSAPV